MPSSRSADITCLLIAMGVSISRKSLALKGCSMPTTPPVPEGRRLKRVVAKKRASLVINLENLERSQKRLPCLVVDATQHGFRVHVGFRLRRGQVVELVLDEDPLSAVRCSVVWVGKPGTKQQGEAGTPLHELRSGTRLGESQRPQVQKADPFEARLEARGKQGEPEPYMTRRSADP